MTAVITPIDISNTSFTFGTWVARTNTIIDFITSNAVSLDATSGGAISTGNGVVNGIFAVTTLGVSTALRGGNVSTAAALNVSSNTVFINGANTVLSVNSDIVTSNVSTKINNLLTVAGNVAITTGNLAVTGQVTLSNTVLINNTTTVNSALTITGLTSTSNVISVGNSTINLVINSTSLNIGGTIVNSTSSGSSANIVANTVQVGNSTVNVFINSTSIVTGNTSLLADRLAVGNSTVNTYITQTAFASGNTTANLTISSTTLRVGNSSVNTSVNTSAISTGTVIDTLGDVRTIPQNPQTTGYTLVLSDAGKHISITTGGVTVPASVFSTGQAVTIFNNSGSNQTITQGGSVTLRFAGTANTGNRTLAQYGLVSILCVAGNTFAISGAGLS